jgi:MFS family permease
VLVVGVLALFLPRVRDVDAGRWRPHAPRVAAGLGRMFAAGALGISAVFVVGSVFLALGAQVARQLIPSSDAFVDGAVLAVSAVSIGVVAILARRLRPRRALGVAPFVVLVGVAALVASGATHSLTLFVASSVVTGAGYSLLFAGGLGVIARYAPAHHRAAAISAVYAVGYLMQAGSAIALGFIATGSGLLLAIEIGSIATVALAAAAAVVANAGPRGTLTRPITVP